MQFDLEVHQGSLLRHHVGNEVDVARRNEAEALFEPFWQSYFS